MPQLDKINEKFQSDKGGKHCYLNEYYQLKFDPIRLATKKLLEIGVYEGASIRLWKDFFVNADIYALEKLHKRSGMFDNEDRIHLVIGDSTSWESYSSIPNDIDIIIDDGSHKPQDQFLTFQQAFNKLADGGLYIIEDVRDIESLSSLLKEINFKIYDFRNKAEPDSVIFEIIK
jgi:fibrillarin-like rRNA methylase